MAQRYRDRPESERALLHVARYADLVDALRDGLRRKRELAERLDVSPETVYRRTRDLRDSGLLERTPSGYALTNLGSLYARQYDAFRDVSDRLYDARTLLDHLDADDLPPWQVFLDADIVTADQQVPERPSLRFEEQLRGAERFDGAFPVLSKRLVPSLTARPDTDGEPSRIALDDSVVDHYRTRDDEQFAAVLDHGGLAVREVRESLTYGVVRAEFEQSEVVALTVYDERGSLKGLVTSESPVAVAWASEQFGRFWSAGRPVSDESAIA